MEIKLEQYPVIEEYFQYLELEKGLAKNSVAAYYRDIVEFINFSKPDINLRVSGRIISNYMEYLNKSGRQPSSIARKLSSLKNFYNFVVEKGILKQNQFELLRAPKISRYHPDYLSVHDIEKILEQPGKKNEFGIRDRAILEILYGTGMRISELINLRMSSVYDEVGFIKIVGKGNKERLVPYGQYAKKAVENYLIDYRESKRNSIVSDILFLSSRSRKFSRTGIWKLIKKYVIRAGITKNVTPHTFRHSFATHMIEGGADLRVVQELLGHSSITTTQIYTQIDRDYLLSVHKDFHPREKNERRQKDKTKTGGRD
jgi:integrase/recombinase XerD